MKAKTKHKEKHFNYFSRRDEWGPAEGLGQIYFSATPYSGRSTLNMKYEVWTNLQLTCTYKNVPFHESFCLFTIGFAKSGVENQLDQLTAKDWKEWCQAGAYRNQPCAHNKPNCSMVASPFCSNPNIGSIHKISCKEESDIDRCQLACGAQPSVKVALTDVTLAQQTSWKTPTVTNHQHKKLPYPKREENLGGKSWVTGGLVGGGQVTWVELPLSTSASCGLASGGVARTLQADTRTNPGNTRLATLLLYKCQQVSYTMHHWPIIWYTGKSYAGLGWRRQ